ncbi:hypothetical protein ACIQ6V_29730 [Streptomyces sp. NPDC096198]|uniref:hypothetical protein n=1 Tax=Streptomyces sp. NPDC096198 TaxID=3366080 RepID=UPI00382E6DE7
MRRRTMRRAVLVGASGTLAAASLLMSANPASAKIGDLYEDHEVSTILASSIHLPPAVNEDKLPMVESMNFTKLTKEELDAVYPFARVEQEIKAKDPNAVVSDLTDLYLQFSPEQRRALLAENPNVNNFTGFSGVLSKEQSPAISTDGYTGAADRKFTTSHSVTNTNSESDTHTAGGKVTANVGFLGSGTSVEASYSYSTMSTDSTAMEMSSSDEKSQKIPEKALGWIEGYKNGADYVGWVTYKEPSTSAYQVIPAKAFFKSDKAAYPITWIQRGKALPIF